MSVKTDSLEELLKEGEYETPFGKITISRTGSGYRITFYIDERELGRSIAKQIALSLVSPHLGREQIV